MFVTLEADAGADDIGFAGHGAACRQVAGDGDVANDGQAAVGCNVGAAARGQGSFQPVRAEVVAELSPVGELHQDKIRVARGRGERIGEQADQNEACQRVAFRAEQQALLANLRRRPDSHAACARGEPRQGAGQDLADGDAAGGARRIDGGDGAEAQQIAEQLFKVGCGGHAPDNGAVGSAMRGAACVEGASTHARRCRCIVRDGADEQGICKVNCSLCFAKLGYQL